MYFDWYYEFNDSAGVVYASGCSAIDVEEVLNNDAIVANCHHLLRS